MQYRILTVDDSRTIRMIVKKAFKDYECELLEAENGRDGLALAAEIKPHLIILDITMPVMTGIEMLGKMLEDEALRDTNVIMLTAESGNDHIKNIVKMGVKDYIVKPFKGDQLVERVKLILDLKPKINAPVTGDGKKGDGLFTVNNDVVILNLPKKIKRAVITEVENAVKDKISQMAAANARKFIVNICAVESLGMAAIQLIISIINRCARAKLMIRLVAATDQMNSIQGFKETSVIPVLSSNEDAVADFQG